MLFRAQLDGTLGDVRYPLWRGDRNQTRMSALYRTHEQLTLGWRQNYANPRHFRRMRTQFRKFIFSELSHTSRAILSSEIFSNLTQEQVGQLRHDLESLGFRIFHIVLYVRDPADMYLSATQYHIKSGGSATGPEFVNDPAEFRYEFLQAAQTWESIFPGSLIVRRFPGTEHGHDVIQDFQDVALRCIGISLPRYSVRLNRSLSAEGMQILQDYKQSFWPDNEGLPTPDTASLAKFLEWSVSDLPQTRPTLKADVAQQIRSNHKVDAQKLFDRYGVDMGLSDVDAGTRPPSSSSGRVDEILESVDPAIVHRLLLLLARTELSRRPAGRSLQYRIGARAYHSIPSRLKPARLESRLRAVAARDG